MVSGTELHKNRPQSTRFAPWESSVSKNMSSQDTYHDPPVKLPKCSGWMSKSKQWMYDFSNGLKKSREITKNQMVQWPPTAPHLLQKMASWSFDRGSASQKTTSPWLKESLGAHHTHCNHMATQWQLPSRRLQNNAHSIPAPTQFSSLWISLCKAEAATGGRYDVSQAQFEMLSIPTCRANFI